MWRAAWVGIVSVALLAGCARGPLSLPASFDGVKWDVDRVDALPRNADPYFAELQERSIELARAELTEFDWVDTAHFVALAYAAQRGELVPPVDPADRQLSQPEVQLFTIPFVELTGFVKSVGGRLRAGPQIAGAQAYFECWVQEAEEGHQGEDVDLCKDRFEELMQIVRVLAPLPGDLAVVLSDGGGVQIDGGGNTTTLDKPFAAGSTAINGGDVPVTEAEIREAFAASLEASPEPPKLFRVGFGFNDYDLDDDDRELVSDAVTEALSRDHAEIIITGHADALGSRRQNLLLSQVRADAVRREVLYVIADRGVPDGKITVPRARARADRDLLVDSPSQAAENRRVELLVR